MSTTAPPPPVRRIVTGHGKPSDGAPKAIIEHDSQITPKPVLPSGAGSRIGTLWTVDTPKPNLNDARDLAIEGYQPERVAPVNGARCGFIDYPPNQISPLHRTVTLDYAVILQGSLVLHLDDGTTTRANAGDVIIQRGTMHAWENPSSTEWTRMFYVAADAEPYVVKTQLEQQFLPPPKPAGKGQGSAKSP